MNKRITLLVASLALALAQAGCALPASNSGASSLDDNLHHDVRYQRTDRKAFKRMAYAATGIGLSRLEPDTSEIPNTDVNDRINSGGQIALGVDLSRQLSVELHSADLGSAGLSPDGRINYHLHGGSALLYAGKNRHRYRRTGLSGYGRVGVGKLENSAVGDNVRYKQLNGAQALFGVGAEYGTRFGIGLRGEFLAIDKDVSYGQLALVYRLGRKPERKRELVAGATVPEAAPVTAPVAAVAVVASDSDGDGVYDATDQCLQSKPASSVDITGCALFSGVLKGVNFYSGSATLTADAEVKLDGVASTLLQYPVVTVNVVAHTDSRGSESSNQGLSEARANSVVDYLSKQGVGLRRLKASAFGETRPAASNDTPEGRLENRRVELFAE